jgi:two-component system, NarL family, response regulator LiaR
MADIFRHITAREQEVLHLLASGMTYSNMAQQLGITAETVKKHLKNIYRKLEVGNKIEALNRVKIIE